MIVGFTGTRRGMTQAQLDAVGELLILKLRPTEFHHGSCQGADVEAARKVKLVFGDRVKVIAHPGPDGDPHREDSGVDDLVLPGKAHFARNRDIVAACEVLVAAPQYAERQDRGGTEYTIAHGLKAGIDVLVVLPDGTLEV